MSVDARRLRVPRTRTCAPPTRSCNRSTRSIRSTAEELETSKEELQSVNEELQTVNSVPEGPARKPVACAFSDLQNLIAATDFGTLFLDADLHIKLFTPRLTELFNVMPSDVGRPITDFAHQLEYEELQRDVRRS